MNFNHEVISRDEWTEARIQLLQKEKVFSKMRDELSALVMALPWEKVDNNYEFDSDYGPLLLSDLFGSKEQLIIYHFMFEETWDAGCPSCSLITDGIDPMVVHLGNRNVAVALVSKAPIEKLSAFKKRMGWNVNWVSTKSNEFSIDFQANTDEVTGEGKYYYNYEMMSRYPLGEQPGLSVFCKDGDGQIYHTYSTYARGLESFVGAYSLLNIVPMGRDEADLPWGMDWVKLHDKYKNVKKDEKSSVGCNH